MENNTQLDHQRLLNLACDLANINSTMGIDSNEYKAITKEWDKASNEWEVTHKTEPKRIYPVNPIDINTLNADIKHFYFSVFEPDDERSEDELYIQSLARQKKDKGVYMIYESYEGHFKGAKNTDGTCSLEWIESDKDMILPIYIGKTVSFRIRMWQHRQYRSDVLQRYTDACNNEEWVTKHPFVGLHVAFWLIESAEERTFKEHELIGKYRPPFNKR